MNPLWTSGVVAIVWVCLLGSILGTTTGGTTPASPATTVTSARR